MKKSELISLVREVMQELDEANVTNVGGASFTPGAGAQYATPNAFSKNKKTNKATKFLNFTPKNDLKLGLSKTIDWMK